MEQINYPVKYAILGIKGQIGWTLGGNELEREYAVSGYIVSKVYLVGEKIKYNSDGTSEKSYQVVFPYSEFKNMRREKPSYDINYQCWNYTDVLQVFEDFEQAKEIANEKNSKLRAKCWLHVSFKAPDWENKIKEKTNEFDNRLKSYMEFEQKILKETEDMIIIKEEKGKSRVREL